MPEAGPAGPAAPKGCNDVPFVIFFLYRTVQTGPERTAKEDPHQNDQGEERP